MKTDKEHIQTENEKKLFSGLTVNYSKSKDDVWNSIEDIIKEGLGINDKKTKTVLLKTTTCLPSTKKGSKGGSLLNFGKFKPKPK